MAEKDKFKKKGTEAHGANKGGGKKTFQPKNQGPKNPNREEEGNGKKNFAKSDKPAFNKKEKGGKTFFSKSGGKKKLFQPKQEEEEGGKKHFGRKSKTNDGKGKKHFKKKFDANANIPEYNFSKINKVKGAKGKDKEDGNNDGLIRLNRYVANAGVCSRREADELIANGQIFVNGRVVKEMGFKVKQFDRVEYQGKVLKRERKVYVLLNKPKGYITTMDDPEDRRTVMDLVQSACNERIYPVGRLDRATSGVLLLTNDGELATALAHPSGNVKKIYRVELNTDIKPEHFEAIANGIELEDGFIKPDSIAMNEIDQRVIGVEIHSGRNRIVRRMFEHFGYAIDRLDRTSFAGLTKKDIPRGKWRYLREGELVRLKHFEKF